MSDTISVLIPTRDRPDTLRHALRTVIGQSYANIEVIVADNSDGTSTRRIVEEFVDDRIRHICTERPLSMSENFEFAVSHASGDWIAVIGDDDGILPTGLERGLAALKTTSSLALGSSLAEYYWPESSEPEPDMYLTVPRGRGYEIRNSNTHMIEVLNGATWYGKSPMLYTGGIVSSKLVREVKSRRGSFFYSQIPDVYSAFAICSVVDRFLYMREPLFVNAQSQRVSRMNPKGMAGLLFAQENTHPWHPDIAAGDKHEIYRYIYASLPIMVYESFLQTNFLRAESGHTKPADQLRVMEYRLSKSLRADPDYQAAILDWMEKFRERHGLGKSIGPSYRKYLLRSRHKARNVFGKYRVDQSFGIPHQNIYDACATAEAIFRRRPPFIGNLFNTARRKVRTTKRLYQSVWSSGRR